MFLVTFIANLALISLDFGYFSGVIATEAELEEEPVSQSAWDPPADDGLCDFRSG